ncbi:hypothetical protein D9V37_05355 [Nocardioides mangrovicus]|uniref:CoA transferase n=1 Tax=Nocardioides mangrovicus TaxID=2478913 RepID=A0A3L8P4X4_9ACTN|nr:CoA transferase [Nocardioides mangrovicus]RLV50275.1 hypothetical protein D9V37_05355 [Nocardioides mangrovicus]
MSTLEDWATSGALALTGRTDGPPLVPPGRAASVVREQLAGLGLEVPGLLGERAAYAGLRRRGPRSCGGAFRVLRTLDGHVGLTLARPEDEALVPALVEQDVGEPWAGLAAWARRTTTKVAAERMELLGLPGGAVPTLAPGPAVRTEVLGERQPSTSPLVIDLTSMWAGPLCAHLLGLTGVRVIKVESSARPDGARGGPAAFFDLLHAGHEQLVLDLPRELDVLRRLVAEADLVLESSRPRALRHLGLMAHEVVAAGTSWLSITAHGRCSPSVGFGDDVAARAGLVVGDADDLLPVSDAIADPLAGVAAAIAARDALATTEARLVDVSMLGVAACVVEPAAEGRVVRDGEGTWWAEDATGRYAVREPRERPCC